MNYELSGTATVGDGFSLDVRFEGSVEYQPADAINPPNTHIEATVLSTYEELSTQLDSEDLHQFPNGVDSAAEAALLDLLAEKWEDYV